MIVLPPGQAHQVLTGRKTMHRLPVTEPRTIQRTRKIGQEHRKYGPAYTTRPYTPAAGDILEVQGGETNCRIHLVDIRRELLGDITFTDARLEGHRAADAVAAFKAAWVQARDAAWLQRQELGLDAEVLVGRFDARHAGLLVWALTFEVDTSHRPRLLVPEAGTLNVNRHHEELGYTETVSDAMRDEPEAVDEATTTLLVKRGREQHADIRGAVDEALLAQLGADKATLEERLTGLRTLAQERGVNIRSDLRALERRLDAIERRIRDQRDRQRAA